MLKKETSTFPEIKAPNYITMALVSTFGLAMAGLQVWNQFELYQQNTSPETFQWLAVSGLTAFAFLLTVFWLIGRLIWKVLRLRKIRKAHEGDIKYLRGELDRGLRELNIQQEMQQNFLANGSMNALLEHAAELIRVQNISFWQLVEDDTKMDCLNALAVSKHAFERGTQITEDQFPSLFRRVLANESLVYPEVSALITGEESDKPKLGNLLHYIENNQVAALLIIPIELDGNVVGAAWFEHCELKRQWTIRDQNQANFVAAIFRMQLQKNLQDGIIKELSSAVLQFDNFRNQADFGLCWFELPLPVQLDQDIESLVRTIGKTARLEEANDEGAKNLIEDTQLLGTSLERHLPSGLLHELLKNNLQISNYEWEHQHNGKREVLMVSLYGICIRGELVGIWYVSQDITAIKEKEWETSTLLHNTVGVLSLLNDDNLIVFDSDSISQLGYDRNDRIGKNILSYIYPADLELFEQSLFEIRKQGGQAEELAQVRMQDAHENWKYFQVSLKNLEGEPHAEGILIEMHDIELQLNTMREQDEKIHFLDSLIKNSDEVVMVLNKEGFIIYESENSQTIIGYTADERIGKYGFEGLHQADLEELELALTKINEGKLTTHRQHVQFLQRNGKWREMEYYLQRNQQGQLVARLKDLSNAKKNALKQANREALLQTFLNASDRVYVLSDSRGKIKFASGDTKKLLGIPTERLVGAQLGKMILPNEKDAFTKHLDILSQDRNAHIQMHLHLQDGHKKYHPFLLVGHGHVLEKSYTGLLLALEKLTLDDESEQNLALKANFFQSLANSFPGPLFFLDHQHEIRFANIASQNLLGRQAKGNFIELIKATEQPQVLQWLQNNPADKIEIAFQGEDQEVIYRKVRAFELKGSRLKGVLLYVLPKSIEEEVRLQQAFDRIDQLTKEVETHKIALENVETHEVLEEKLNAYRNQLSTLNDELALKESEHQRFQKMIENVSEELDQLHQLKIPAQTLDKHYQSLLEILQKYREISPEIPLDVQIEEIQKFGEMINFEIVLEESKSYIQQIRSTLEAVETTKG